ncbi:MAG: SpaA isopeptide-forming pilin-related protein [Finegoldia sp.]|nr:SpaA isopeptide-forming pilin-related protein [Finegoldia sp.]
MSKYLKRFLAISFAFILSFSGVKSYAESSNAGELDVLISSEYLEKNDDFTLDLWDISGADTSDRQKLVKELEGLSKEDLEKNGYSLQKSYSKKDLSDADRSKYDPSKINKVLKLDSLKDKHTYYLTDRSDNKVKLSSSIFTYPADTAEGYIAMKNYTTGDRPVSKQRVKLIKVNDKEERLAGAKFTLYKLDKKDGSQVKVADYETDQNGEIIVENLDQGSYVFRETQAPQGYKIVQDGVEFVYNKKELNLTVVNLPQDKEVTSNKLRLVKVDDEDKRLAGAKFKLYRLEGEEEVEVEEGKLYTTDSNGEIVVENLPKGKYNFKEVEAPSGYEIVQENVKFDYDKGDLDLKVVNKKKAKGRKEFRKTDESGSNFLEGATFKVTELNDDGVYSIVKKDEKEYLVSSDKEGKFVVDGLDYGTYYLFEVKAPQGYKLLSDPVEFKIEENNGDTQEVMMIKNKKDTTVPPTPTNSTSTSTGTTPSNPIKIPKTGDIVLPILTLAGAIIFVTGFKLSREK